MRRPVHGFFYASRFMVGDVLGSRKARRLLGPLCQPGTSSAAISLTALVGGLNLLPKRFVMNNQSQVTPEFRPHVTVIDGQIKTNSLKVAEHFGKRHDTVLRAIQNIECSDDFRLRNFAEASYEVDQPNGGKASYIMIEMTRDGFTFLAMGFTGAKAAQWKEAYINAFNQMADELYQKSQYGLKQLPEPKTQKALPGGLTLEQQDCIKALVKERVQQLPKEKQGGAATSLWSAVKSKFGVGYKEIPSDQFTAVVSLIARVELKNDPLLHVTPLELAGLVEQKVKDALTGEFIAKDCPKYQYPITDWKPETRYGHTAYLTYQELKRVNPMNRPLWRLLYQLKKDSHDVEGAEAEYNALKVLTNTFYQKLDGLKTIFETLDGFGENIYLP